MINTNSLIFFINSMALFIVLICYIFFEFEFSDNLIFFILLLVLTLLVVFCFKKENNNALRNNLFKHSTLFLIGLLVVNFQKYLDYYLGYIDETSLLQYVSENTAIKSIFLGLIGLLSFLIGYLLGIKKTKVYKNFNNNNTFFLSILNTFFLMGFLVFINPLYVYGGYGIHEMGLNAVYFSVLFKSSVFALIIQKIINSNLKEVVNLNFYYFVKYIGIYNIFLILFYLSIVLLSGDRGDIIQFSLLFLIAYINITGRKINRLKSMVMIFLAAFFITILGMARSFNSIENTSFLENINKSLLGESNKVEVPSIIPVTAELSDSIKALHYSVEYVPNTYDYMYSRFHFQAILGIVPFSSNISNFIFSNNSVEYQSSDSYITWLIEGDNPTTGHGTSIIADFYLSYGLIGVVLGMFSVGWLLRFCEQNIILKNNRYLIFLIISIVFFCSSIYLARSSIFPSIRLIVWVWILMLLNEWLNKRLAK